MSWFYPLQKLFGYEVGPEDQTEDEELGQLASDLRKTGEQQGFRQPENPVEFRAMVKRKDAARLEELKNRKHLSMKDTDIYVSRQKDPEVREYQEKAVRKMRLSDAGLKASMFFQDPIMGQVETGLPPNDPRVPTIKSMTKNEEASARTREVVKAIDFFNQSVPVQKRPNQFIGERPSASDILGKEISRNEEVNRFNWKNFPPMTISVLEDIPSQEYKKGSYTFGAYTPKSKRIEWRKPVTDKEKTAIAHEQLHRFIYEHPAGKPFRHLKGDHELFVRAYTHLLNGGELTDRELAADLLDARGNYKGINIDRFAENVHNYVDAFENAVLTHSTGVKQATVVDGTVVVTPSRIERQMQQLLSTSKQDEYYPTFVKNLKGREGDHGNIPMPTNDEREKHLPKNERSLDIGYGHKIKPNELETGEIYGIKFKDSNGDYIPLTEKDKVFILEQDISFEINSALELGWNKKLKDRDLVWEELPTKYKYPLIDLAFNVGFEGAQSWNAIFDDVKNNDDKLFVKNLRRQNAGKWDNGLDNRVAKVAYAVGLVDSLKQAKEYGLKLADTNDIPLGKKDYTPVPSSLLQSILNK